MSTDFIDRNTKSLQLFLCKKVEHFHLLSDSEQLFLIDDAFASLDHSNRQFRDNLRKYVATRTSYIMSRKKFEVETRANHNTTNVATGGAVVTTGSNSAVSGVTVSGVSTSLQEPGMWNIALLI